MEDSTYFAEETIITDTLPEHQTKKDFRAFVGEGWDNVYPEVRTRMDKLLTTATGTTFVGNIKVECSRIGWIYAQCLRLLGSPLVWKQGKDVNIRVRIAPTKKGFRCWHRQYRFTDGSQQIVATSKIVHPRLGALEAVGTEGNGLLAAKMYVWAANKSLYFASDKYFLRLGMFYLPIPTLLTPGTLLVEHQNIGNGFFRYIHRFTHPIWGRTFYQDGIFREEKMKE